MTAEPRDWTFDRLPNLVRRHRIPTGVVLHVGAHLGEEVPTYRECGFSLIRLVEPDPDQVGKLRSQYGNDPDIEIIAAACVPDNPGTVKLNRAENSMFDSVSAAGPGIEVPAVLLVDIQDDASLIVLDAQGLELALLHTIDLNRSALQAVIIETTQSPNEIPYSSDAHFANRYMLAREWVVAAEWIYDGYGCGDTVFVRKSHKAASV